jgi:hypothetical protein
MKRKMIVGAICFILASVGLSSVISAQAEESLENEESLHVGVFGSSMLIGLRRVGCLITNPGENTLHDVHWVFSIREVDSDVLIFTYDEYAEELDPSMSIIFSTDQVNDIGFVEITATVNCSQTGEITDSKMMFQLGPFFIGSPFLLAYM